MQQILKWKPLIRICCLLCQFCLIFLTTWFGIPFFKRNIETFSSIFFQLLGHFEDGLWQGGLLQKILRDASFMSDAVKTYLKNYKKQEQTKQKHKNDLPSVLLKWVVLDGMLHPNWTEGLNTILDSERKLSMANGGRVALNSKSFLMRFWLEIISTNKLDFDKEDTVWNGKACSISIRKNMYFVCFNNINLKNFVITLYNSFLYNTFLQVNNKVFFVMYGFLWINDEHGFGFLWDVIYVLNEIYLQKVKNEIQAQLVLPNQPLTS